MWPQSADDSPSSNVSRGIGGCCMTWSAAMNDAGVCCLVIQVSAVW